MDMTLPRSDLKRHFDLPIFQWIIRLLLTLIAGIWAVTPKAAPAATVSEAILVQVTSDFASLGYEDGTGGGYVVAGNPNTKPKVVRGLGNARTNHTNIGCSSFANAVIHRLRKGNYQGITYSFQQAFGGAAIADGYSLASVGAWNLTAFLAAQEKGELPAGVFYFDLRNEKGWKNGRHTTYENGMAGHVGFLVIEVKNGKNLVKEYQMTQKAGGLAKGAPFRDYLTWSQFGRTAALLNFSKIELYRL